MPLEFPTDALLVVGDQLVLNHASDQGLVTVLPPAGGSRRRAGLVGLPARRPARPRAAVIEHSPCQARRRAHAEQLQVCDGRAQPGRWP
ncbi:MAG: hypothetical protein IPG96_08105 [Proteobacteria bacterium]|nr:hypothetical protein [Pseudomonadota bacterium]